MPNTKAGDYENERKLRKPLATTGLFFLRLRRALQSNAEDLSMADFAFELETLDELPDEHKALYKETDGKFTLSLDAYGEHVKQPVVKKNKELLGKLNQAKGLERLEKFKDVADDDWDAYQQWKEAQPPPAEPGKAEAGKSGTDPDFLAKLTKDREREIQKIKDAHAKEMEAFKGKLAEVESKRLADKKEVLLQEVANKTGVLADRRSTWLKEARDRYQLDEHERLVAIDKEDGLPLDVPAEKYSRETLFTEFPFLYESPQMGGSNAQAGNGKTGAMAGLKRGKMGPADKAAFIRKHGLEAYNRLAV